MKPGPTLVLQIPATGSHVKIRTVHAGNTFSATYWSDGKVDSTMFPDFPRLRLNPLDHSFFWTDDCPKVGEIDHYTRRTDLPPPWQTAPYAQDPGEADYVRALHAGMADSPERHIYLRTRLWWKSNDPRRRLRFKRQDLTPFQHDNLQTLAALMDEADPQQRLLKAEALRELGDFAAACRLLSTDFPVELQAPVRRIAELAIDRVATVAKLPIG